MKKVFLGGTCNSSQWRSEVISNLDGIMDCFDPVVPNWNEEAYKRELYERQISDYVVYTITPKITGFYSIAEAVDDSNKRPKKTLLCCMHEDDGEVFSEAQEKSLKAVAKMVISNGGHAFDNLNDLIEFLKKNKSVPHDSSPYRLA